MKLKVITPDRVVLEEDVDAVYAQTTDGQVGILPRHIPLVTALDVGVLRFEQAGAKHPVAVMGGLLRTNGTEISVIASAAERAEDIDTTRASEAKKRAEARLSKQVEDTDVQRAKTALMRATVRLSLK